MNMAPPKHSAPVLVSNKRQALSETLKNFTVEIQKVKKKEKKMKRLCRKTDNAFELQQIKQQLQEQDDLELQPALKVLESSLKAGQRSAAASKAKHEIAMSALDGLIGQIRSRSEEVRQQTEKLKAAAYEWQAANNTVVDSCQRAGFHAYDKFQSWQQSAPVLNTWLNCEGQLHRSIYASGWVFGLQTELYAQSEVKKMLTDFEESHYSKLNQIPASQLPTIKQVQEQRQIRSEAFDQLHWRLLKQLRLMVKQCDYLQLEIESREHIRARLKTLTMELHSALEEDCQEAVAQTVDEARRSLQQIIQVIAAQPIPDKQEMIMNLLSEGSRICPAVLDNEDLRDLRRNAVAAIPEQAEPVKPEQSIISGLSDDDVSVQTKAELKYMNTKHLQMLATSAGVGSTNSPAATHAKMDSLLGVGSVPNKTKRTIRAQTKDFPRNLDRIHIRLKGIHEALKKSTEEQNTDSAHVAPENGTVKLQRDGKDPVYELLAAKRAVRKMQSCCAHASYDSITSYAQDSLHDLPQSIAEDGDGLLSRPMRVAHFHAKMAAAYSSNRQEMENWMEQGIADKYKVALNLLNGELAKRDWHVELTSPPISAAYPDYAHDERLGLQLDSSLAHSLASNNNELLADNEELLLRINKQLSSDEHEMDIKKQMEGIAKKETETRRLLEELNVDSVEDEDDLHLQVVFDGDHFHVTMHLQPSGDDVLMIARRYTQRNVCLEFSMLIQLQYLCEVTGWDLAVVQQQLQSDLYRFYQNVNSSLRMESIPVQFYGYLVDKLITNNGAEGMDLETVDNMLRAPSGQDPPKDMPNVHVLKVLTLRSRSGGLLKFAFATQRHKPNA